MLVALLAMGTLFTTCGDKDEEINVVTPELKEYEPYAALSNGNKVLAFYYDTQKEERGGMSIGPFGASSVRGWNNNCKNLQSQKHMGRQVISGRTLTEKNLVIMDDYGNTYSFTKK